MNELWKENYVNSLLNKIPHCYNKEEYVKRMNKIYLKNHSKKLYKYLSCDEYALLNFKNNQMTYSRPKDFNDPYDCAIYTDFKKAFTLISDYNEIKQQIQGMLPILYIMEEKKCYIEIINLIKSFIGKDIDENLFENIQDAILNDKELIGEYKKSKNAFLEKISVGCLSERNNSILMWSHYGMNHTGFCIEYDFEDIKKYNRIFLPAIYKNEFNDMSYDIMNGNLLGALYPLITKAKEWSYEEEWRAIETDMKSCEKRRFVKMPKPKAVYLGCKINAINEKKIIKLCIEKNIQVYKMKMRDDSFKLEYVPIKYFEDYLYIKSILAIMRRN